MGNALGSLECHALVSGCTTVTSDLTYTYVCMYTACNLPVTQTAHVHSCNLQETQTCTLTTQTSVHLGCVQSVDYRLVDRVDYWTHHFA